MTAIPVKRAAASVGEWSDLLARYALSAGAQAATPDTMRLDLAKLHAIWPKLCRAMVMLEGLTPASTQAGQDEDAFIRDWLDRRAEMVNSSAASIGP